MVLTHLRVFLVDSEVFALQFELAFGYSDESPRHALG